MRRGTVALGAFMIFTGLIMTALSLPMYTTNPSQPTYYTRTERISVEVLLVNSTSLTVESRSYYNYSIPINASYNPRYGAPQIRIRGSANTGTLTLHIMDDKNLAVWRRGGIPYVIKRFSVESYDSNFVFYLADERGIYINLDQLILVFDNAESPSPSNPKKITFSAFLTTYEEVVVNVPSTPSASSVWTGAPIFGIGLLVLFLGIMVTITGVWRGRKPTPPITLQPAASEDFRPLIGVCGYCGAENAADAVFCHKCGERIGKR